MGRRSAKKKIKRIKKRFFSFWKKSPFSFRIHHPLHLHTGPDMHPYMRTMFATCAIGTISVLVCMGYYIHVAQATEWMMQEGSTPVTSTVAVASDSPFFSVINDLENQDADSYLVAHTPPREYLHRQLEAIDLEDRYDLLNRIAYCESKWQMVPNAISSAYGYFQIIDGTEKLTPQYKAGLRKTDPYANIDMAIYLYQKYGTLPWVASRHCWR